MLSSHNTRRSRHYSSNDNFHSNIPSPSKGSSPTRKSKPSPGRYHNLGFHHNHNHNNNHNQNQYQNQYSLNQIPNSLKYSHRSGSSSDSSNSDSPPSNTTTTNDNDNTNSHPSASLSETNSQNLALHNNSIGNNNFSITNTQPNHQQADSTNSTSGSSSDPSSSSSLQPNNNPSGPPNPSNPPDNSDDQQQQQQQLPGDPTPNPNGSNFDLSSFQESATGYPFLRALHSFDASSLFSNNSEEDPSSICLSFQESEIVLLHSIHPSGWGDATILSNAARGWIPTNYFTPYSDPKIVPVLSAVLNFVLAPKSHPLPKPYYNRTTSSTPSDPNEIKYTFSPAAISAIVAGVRSLLEACGTLTRDTPIVRRSQSIRKFRKILLAELAILVSLAKQYKYTTDDANIERLVAGSYKIIFRAVIFLDIWTIDMSNSSSSTPTTSASTTNITPAIQNNENSSSGVLTSAISDSTGVIPPTQPQTLTQQQQQSSNANNNNSSSQVPSLKKINPPSSTQQPLRQVAPSIDNLRTSLSSANLNSESDNNQIIQKQPLETNNEDQEPMSMLSSPSTAVPIISRSTNQFSNRDSVVFHSAPPFALHRLDEVNDALTCYLSNFLHRTTLLETDPTACTQILVNTRKSMLACRELLAAVESISSKSLPRNKELEACKDNLFIQIRHLVTAARDVVASTPAAAGDVLIRKSDDDDDYNDDDDEDDENDDTDADNETGSDEEDVDGNKIVSLKRSKKKRNFHNDPEDPNVKYQRATQQLIEVASTCARISGECVVRCRHIIDIIGDFQLSPFRPYPDFSDGIIAATQDTFQLPPSTSPTTATGSPSFNSNENANIPSSSPSHSQNNTFHKYSESNSSDLTDSTIATNSSTTFGFSTQSGTSSAASTFASTQALSPTSPSSSLSTLSKDTKHASLLPRIPAISPLIPLSSNEQSDESPDISSSTIVPSSSDLNSSLSGADLGPDVLTPAATSTSLSKNVVSTAAASGVESTNNSSSYNNGSQPQQHPHRYSTPSTTTSTVSTQNITLTSAFVTHPLSANTTPPAPFFGSDETNYEGQQKLSNINNESTSFNNPNSANNNGSDINGNDTMMMSSSRRGRSMSTPVSYNTTGPVEMENNSNTTHHHHNHHHHHHPSASTSSETTTSSQLLSNAPPFSKTISMVPEEEFEEMSENVKSTTSTAAAAATSTSASVSNSHVSPNTAVSEADIAYRQAVARNMLIQQEIDCLSLPERILIEQPSGRVRAGTLDAFVKILTDERTAEEPDPNFVSAFFLTFRQFTTPLEFTDALIRRFNARNTLRKKSRKKGKSVSNTSNTKENNEEEINNHENKTTNNDNDEGQQDSEDTEVEEDQTDIRNGFLLSPEVASARRHAKVFNILKRWMESHWKQSADGQALSKILEFANTQMIHFSPQTVKAALTDLAAKLPTLPDGTVLVPRTISIPGSKEVWRLASIYSTSPVIPSLISKHQTVLLVKSIEANEASGENPSSSSSSSVAAISKTMASLIKGSSGGSGSNSSTNIAGLHSSSSSTSNSTLSTTSTNGTSSSGTLAAQSSSSSSSGTVQTSLTNTNTNNNEDESKLHLLTSGSAWTNSLRMVRSSALGISSSSSSASSGGLSTGSHSIITLLDIDSFEIAKQITILDNSLLCRIRPEELLDQNFSLKRRPLGLAPNVTAMTLFTNQLSSFVGDSILNADVPIKTRQKLLKQWVKTAERCYELHNYNSLMTIISALQSVNIMRLRKTWEGLNARYLATFQKLKSLLSMEKNYTNYRAELRANQVPCIPYLGLFLTDLTFVGEGNQPRKLLTLDPNNNYEIIPAVGRSKFAFDNPTTPTPTASATTPGSGISSFFTTPPPPGSSAASGSGSGSGSGLSSSGISGNSNSQQPSLLPTQSLPAAPPPPPPTFAVINFDRYDRTARIIGDLQHFQVPYRITPSQELQTWLKTEMSRSYAIVAKDHNGLWRRSCIVEPKQ